jgi:hypothetical protein
MRNLFSLVLALCCYAGLSQSNLSFRLIADEYTLDNEHTTVSIQVKADDTTLNLADQYYRFYYDASNMKLDDRSIETVLPTSNYYDATIIEHVDGLDASRVGELSYDRNLGFVNLYIELSDLTTGGTNITPQDEWVTVATLDFSIDNTQQPIIATWARVDRTKNYTSAYAIVAEWVNTDEVEVTTQNEYNDLYAMATAPSELEEVEISIGPNPTADYVRVRNAQGFNSDATIVLRDLNGAILQSQNVTGTTEATIELAGYTSGAYLVEVTNGANAKMHTEKIIFTRS